ncbi:MAG: polymer-forming cytoskeletal protein [Akkermansia sp.]|nr:polymer-forming cytoskeletal protein [Akkermansia sp.]
MAFKFPDPRKKNDAPAPSTPSVPTFGESSDLRDWKPVNEPEPVSEPSTFGQSYEPVSSPFDTPGEVPMGVVTRNILNSDVSIVGVLRFTDDLLVDGTVEGEITSDGELTVGANATIQAGGQTKVAVRTRSAIIHGRVTGDVVVTDRVELSSTAELVGDVTASKISIQEGAVFIGHCMVGVATAAAIPAEEPTKKTMTTKAPVTNNMDLLG